MTEQIEGIERVAEKAKQTFQGVLSIITKIIIAAKAIQLAYTFIPSFRAGLQGLVAVAMQFKVVRLAALSAQYAISKAYVALLDTKVGRAAAEMAVSVSSFKMITNTVIRMAKEMKLGAKAVEFFKKASATPLGATLIRGLAISAIIKFTLLITAAGVAVGKFILNQANNASQLKDLAFQIDTTTKAIQGLKYAAAATGADFDQLSSAMERIRRTQSDALTGNKESQKDYERLGFTLDDLKRLRPEEIFKRISAQVANGTAGARSYSAIIGVMGKEAKTIISKMRNGVAELSDEFANSGLVIKRNVIDQLDEVDKKWKKLTTTIKAGIDVGDAGLASGFVGLGQRAASYIELFKWMAALRAPDSKKFDESGFAEARAKIILKDDEDYGDSKDETTSLQTLAQQQADILKIEEAEALILKEKNDEREHEIYLSRMSASERKKALEVERDSLLNQIEATQSVLAQQKLKEKLLKVEDQLTPHKAASASIGSHTVDSITRIGLYRGGSQETVIVRAIVRQTDSVVKQTEATKKLVITSEDVARKVSSFLFGE